MWTRRSPQIVRKVFSPTIVGVKITLKDNTQVLGFRITLNGEGNWENFRKATRTSVQQLKKESHTHPALIKEKGDSQVSR